MLRTKADSREPDPACISQGCREEEAKKNMASRRDDEWGENEMKYVPQADARLRQSRLSFLMRRPNLQLEDVLSIAHG